MLRVVLLRQYFSNKFQKVISLKFFENYTAKVDDGAQVNVCAGVDDRMSR